MNESFVGAMQNLTEIEQGFATGRLTSLEHSRQREASLVKGLEALARGFGVKLEMPLRIDSRGEFKVIAQHPDGRMSALGCGWYGQAFATLLSKYNPRTGTVPTSHLLPEDGWCYMNHFQVERMLMDYYQAQAQPAADSAE